MSAHGHNNYTCRCVLSGSIEQPGKAQSGIRMQGHENPAISSMVVIVILSLEEKHASAECRDEDQQNFSNLASRIAKATCGQLSRHHVLHVQRTPLNLNGAPKTSNHAQSASSAHTCTRMCTASGGHRLPANSITHTLHRCQRMPGHDLLNAGRTLVLGRPYTRLRLPSCPYKAHIANMLFQSSTTE